jgi:hypothetical protein
MPFGYKQVYPHFFYLLLNKIGYRVLDWFSLLFWWNGWCAKYTITVNQRLQNRFADSVETALHLKGLLFG